MLRGFLSYSHHDRAFVDMLARLLPEVAADLEVFIDRRDHAPGEALSRDLRRRLDEADVLLPCVSPHAAASAWCAQERAWFREGRPGRRILPLRVVPHGGHDGDEAWYPEHVGVDFTGWLRDGDRTFFERLLPALLPGRAPSSTRRFEPDGTRAPTMAQDLIKVMSAVRANALPADVDSAVVQLAIALIQSAGLGAGPRNALCLAVAGHFVQRGDWAALRDWSTASAAATTDDDAAACQFHQHLALAERRLGRHDSAGQHLEAARRYAERLSQPAERRRALGQIDREAGTLAIALDQREHARAHYRSSRVHLEVFVSERAHVAQTWVKTAQIDLLDDDAEAALRCLDRADTILGGELAPEARVHGPAVEAHAAKTRALAHYLDGDLTAAWEAVARHARVIAGRAWANEDRQAAQLTWLIATSAVHPRRLRYELVCKGIQAESRGGEGERRR